MQEATSDQLISDLPAPENKRFYPALDGLRAVAVMMVFFQHYLPSRYPALSWGWTGVDIFFVLSGFLITGILYDTQDHPFRFRNFYMRRTLRIFPLYYGVLLTLLLLTPIFHWLWSYAWVLWALYLGNYATFLSVPWPAITPGSTGQLVSMHAGHPGFSLSLGHFWSLCVEEQFYLLWPMVVYHVRRRETLLKVCCWLILASFTARTVSALFAPISYLRLGLLYSFTPIRVDALLIGALVALCLRGKQELLIRRLARPVLLTGLAVFVTLELLFRVLSTTHIFYRPYVGAPLVDTVGYALLDICAAALIVEVIRPEAALSRLLQRRWLRQLGQISYGFYVFHDIPHAFYAWLASRVLGSREAHGSSLVVIVFAFFGTLILSYLSFRFFEAPFLRLKRNFAA